MYRYRLVNQIIFFCSSSRVSLRIIFFSLSFLNTSHRNCSTDRHSFNKPMCVLSLLEIEYITFEARFHKRAFNPLEAVNRKRGLLLDRCKGGRKSKNFSICIEESSFGAVRMPCHAQSIWNWRRGTWPKIKIYGPPAGLPHRILLGHPAARYKKSNFTRQTCGRTVYIDFCI